MKNFRNHGKLDNTELDNVIEGNTFYIMSEILKKTFIDLKYNLANIGKKPDEGKSIWDKISNFFNTPVSEL